MTITHNLLSHLLVYGFVHHHRQLIKEHS